MSLSLEQEEKTSRLWKIIGQMWNQIKINAVCYDTLDKEYTYISGHCALCDLQMAPRYSCKQCGLEDVCEECMLTVQCPTDNDTTERCLLCFLETEEETTSQTFLDHFVTHEMRDKVLRGYVWHSLCNLGDIICATGPPFRRNMWLLRRLLLEWQRCVKGTLFINLVVEGNFLTALKAFTGDVVASFKLVKMRGLTSRDPVQRILSEVTAEIKEILAYTGKVDVFMGDAFEDICKEEIFILRMPETKHMTATSSAETKAKRLMNFTIPRKNQSQVGGASTNTSDQAEAGGDPS